MIVLKEKLYTSEETAEILGVTTRTLYRYVKNKEIDPETKTRSGTFRFTREEIYKYLYPDKYEKILELLRQREKENPEDTSAYIKHNDSSDQTETSEPVVEASVTEPAESVLPVNEELNTEPAEEPKDLGNTELKEETISMPSALPVESEKETVSTPAAEPEDSDATPRDFDNALKRLEESLNVGSTEPATPAVEDSSMAPESFAVPNTTSTTAVSEPAVNQQPAMAEMPSAPVSVQEEITAPGVSAVPQSSMPASVQSAPATEQNNDSSNKWNYYVNESKGILDLAREVNSLANETGRRYAATMHGGLSLHHEIDEFLAVHFYVEPDDLNWWVQQLGLQPSDKEKANICLITSSDDSILQNAYRLRGLFVVDDQQLIQDLMKHGEKDLARTLI